jgi:hypothetical protein
MKIRIDIEKRHLLYVIITLAIITGINYAIAQTPNPGHSADQIGGYFPPDIRYVVNDRVTSEGDLTDYNNYNAADQQLTIGSLQADAIYQATIHALMPERGTGNHWMPRIGINPCNDSSVIPMQFNGVYVSTFPIYINWPDGNFPLTATLVFQAPSSGCVKAYLFTASGDTSSFLDHMNDWNEEQAGIHSATIMRIG